MSSAAGGAEPLPEGTGVALSLALTAGLVPLTDGLGAVADAVAPLVSDALAPGAVLATVGAPVIVGMLAAVGNPLLDALPGAGVLALPVAELAPGVGL